MNLEGLRSCGGLSGAEAYLSFMITLLGGRMLTPCSVLEEVGGPLAFFAFSWPPALACVGYNP